MERCLSCVLAHDNFTLSSKPVFHTERFACFALSWSTETSNLSEIVIKCKYYFSAFDLIFFDVFLPDRKIVMCSVNVLRQPRWELRLMIHRGRRNIPFLIVAVSDGWRVFMLGLSKQSVFGEASGNRSHAIILGQLKPNRFIRDSQPILTREQRLLQGGTFSLWRIQGGA